MHKHYKEAKNKTLECSSIEVLTKRFYLDNKFILLKKGHPFIVKKFYETPEGADIIYMVSKHFGDKMLKARFHGSNQDYANNRKYVKIPLREYINSIFKSEDGVQPYAANNFIDKDIVELLKIPCPFPEISDTFRDPKIWIGSKNTTTPLHKDSTDNFAIHLYGEKLWSIFSIKDTEHLYFETTRYGDYLNPLAEFEVSKIDLRNISIEEFPLFKKTKQFDISLTEGDLLYIPYGWGHSVRNISSSIMINYWFKLDNYKPLVLWA